MLECLGLAFEVNREGRRELGVCAPESGGPRRKGSGPAGARSHRKSCAGCQKEPLNPQSTKVR